MYITYILHRVRNQYVLGNSEDGKVISALKDGRHQLGYKLMPEITT